MKEIKVGEYIRTYNGLIGKVVRITDVGNYAIRIHNGAEYIAKAVVLKHRQDITDLIETGDYVDKRLVLQVDYKNKNVCLLISFTDTKANINTIWCGQEDIKSIVTHEQFEQVEYKI